MRYDEGLFERLKAWRLERARDDEVPAYVVFTDATLELIAEHKPGDEKALRAISGVGPSKIERYAEEVLARRHRGVVTPTRLDIRPSSNKIQK